MRTNIKKLIICTALVVALTCISACGKENNEAEIAESTTPTTTVTTTEKTTEATTEATTTVETTEESTVTTTEDTTIAETEVPEPEEPEYTVEPMSKTMYTTSYVNIRTGPSTDYDKVTTFSTGTEINVTGRASTGWYEIEVEGEKRYLSDTALPRILCKYKFFTNKKIKYFSSFVYQNKFIDLPLLEPNPKMKLVCIP